MPNHGNDGIVILRLEPDVRLDPDGAERAAHIVVGGFQKRDKRLLCQFLDTADRMFCQRVILWQNSGQRIFIQRRTPAARAGRQRCKRKIDASIPEPCVDIVIISVEKLEIYLRMLLLKLHHHSGQPVCGDAGKCPDADFARDERMKASCSLPQQSFLPHDFMNIWHHLLALRREPRTGAGALQKRQLKFRFHGGKHMTDAGLRESQFLRSFRQRGEFHCFFKNLIFLGIHLKNLLLFPL